MPKHHDRRAFYLASKELDFRAQKRCDLLFESLLCALETFECDLVVCWDCIFCRTDREDSDFIFNSTGFRQYSMESDSNGNELIFVLGYPIKHIRQNRSQVTGLKPVRKLLLDMKVENHFLHYTKAHCQRESEIQQEHYRVRCTHPVRSCVPFQVCPRE